VLSAVAAEYAVEAVGSTTTMIVEKLRDAQIAPTPALATLYVLGIRADTGGLAYESTTLRDAEALCWLLRQGASQSAIAEFSLERVSDDQRAALATALPDVEVESYRGVVIASVAVETPRYVRGLAQIADELLALTAADVLLLACATKTTHADNRSEDSSSKKKKKKPPSSSSKTGGYVDLIGRARPRALAVDLRRVMAPFGGGGHKRAAAASISSAVDDDDDDDASSASEEHHDDDHARRVLDAALASVRAQIPTEVTVGAFIEKSARPVALPDAASIADARKLLAAADLKSVPVVDDDGRLKGQLKLSDVVKAEKKRRGADGVKGWMRTAVATVRADDTLAHLEAMLASNGRLPVVDDDRRLLAVVTRTDVLDARHFYDGPFKFHLNDAHAASSSSKQQQQQLPHAASSSSSSSEMRVDAETIMDDDDAEEAGDDLRRIPPGTTTSARQRSRRGDDLAVAPTDVSPPTSPPPPPPPPTRGASSSSSASNSGDGA